MRIILFVAALFTLSRAISFDAAHLINAQTSTISQLNKQLLDCRSKECAADEVSELVSRTAISSLVNINKLVELAFRSLFLIADPSTEADTDTLLSELNLIFPQAPINKIFINLSNNSVNTNGIQCALSDGITVSSRRSDKILCYSQEVIYIDDIKLCSSVSICNLTSSDPPNVSKTFILSRTEFEPPSNSLYINQTPTNGIIGKTIFVGYGGGSGSCSGQQQQQQSRQ